MHRNAKVDHELRKIWCYRWSIKQANPFLKKEGLQITDALHPSNVILKM
jgi:hypothetical protein